MAVLGECLETSVRTDRWTVAVLKEVSHDSASKFNNSDFITKMTYLSDLFEKLNTL